jgi:hypothetical protein
MDFEEASEMKQEARTGDPTGNMIDTKPLGSPIAARHWETAAVSQAEKDEIRLLGVFLWSCAIAAISVGAILYVMVTRPGL